MVSSGVRHHKSVHWRPWGGKKRPGVLEAIRTELVRALSTRSGSVWVRVKRAAIIAGYPQKDRENRERALRTDGAESLLALAVALLGSVDIRTGFVGVPKPGASWRRFTHEDLAGLAYGGRTPADVRRVQRAEAVMVSLGWKLVTKPVRIATEPGPGAVAFRSEAGIRRLNLERLAEMTGTTWLLRRDRIEADRRRRATSTSATSTSAMALMEAPRPIANVTPDIPYNDLPPPPPLPADPPRASDPRVAREALDAIRKLFA